LELLLLLLMLLQQLLRLGKWDDAAKAEVDLVLLVAYLLL
jgi:hypothetical protein